MGKICRSGIMSDAPILASTVHDVLTCPREVFSLDIRCRILLTVQECVFSRLKFEYTSNSLFNFLSLVKSKSDKLELPLVMETTILGTHASHTLTLKNVPHDSKEPKV